MDADKIEVGQRLTYYPPRKIRATYATSRLSLRKSESE